MILPALINRILLNTDVTNLIGDKLRPGNIEQGEYGPAADIRVVTDKPMQHLTGGIFMHRALIVIDCYGSSVEQADQVHRAIENCGIIGLRGPLNSVFVDGVVCKEAYEHDYEIPFPASDKRRYVSSMTLEVCWH